MDLGNTVTSPYLADPQKFTIVRSKGGTFQAGGWQNNTEQIQAGGVVNVATERDLQQVPEGDRPSAAMVFVSRTQMLSTRTNPELGTSDVIIWRGVQWGVLQTGDYVYRGFFTAIAVRLGPVQP